MATILTEFSTLEVSKVTGFSVRQLDYWATTGLLVPSITKSNGPGTRKLYGFEDLVRLHFIKQLRDVGWSVQKIRKAILHLNDFMKESPEYRNYRLVPDKGTILILCESEEKQHILLDALSPSGQQLLWIILDILRDETRKSASQLISLDRMNRSSSASLTEKKASS